jgi:hypothetical protein
MAYIGTKPTIGNFQICDAISVVNGQAAYTMQVGGVNVSPQSSNHMIVSLNGTIQKPGGANPSFTVSGSTITFASNLATGDVIDFIQILGDVLDLGVPSDATVTAAKIGANAVTAAKLNNDIISGSTELASEPADTDEFLISDAGTLKRIDYSLIKGGGITMADQWRLTADITSNVDPISANLERVDDGSFGYIGTGMSVSSGTWTFPSTGLYQVGATIYTQPNDDSLSVTIQATTNNSSYDVISNVFGGGYQANGRTHTAFSYVNVTNTSNVKVRFGAESIAAGSIIGGNTNSNLTSFNFIRLGDSV